jgi:SAM-dependent methyltransferase
VTELPGLTATAIRRRPPPPEPLMARYAPDDLEVLTPAERARWLPPLGVASLEGPQVREAWPRIREALAWELLYRIEPELYDRLVAGEAVHPAILDWLPRVERAVEVGAGSGRLTVPLARRATEVVAVEPAAPLLDRLRSRLAEEGLENVRTIEGFFDDIPLPDDHAELVVACSAFTVEPEHGGERGLAEMERICRPGGTVAIIWPDDPRWLAGRGYTHRIFAGDLEVSFPSLDEALELARIFYPAAVRAIEEAGRRKVPFDVLGIPPPRDLSWRRLPG